MAGTGFVLLVALQALLVSVEGKVFFKETFDDTWRDRWRVSEHHPEDQRGNVTRSIGALLRHKSISAQQKHDAFGLRTMSDKKYYAVSAQFPKFSSEDLKMLLIQFQLKNEAAVTCAGGYIKVGPTSVEANTWGPESPFHIMFGPDVCGTRKKDGKIQMTFSYKDDALPVKRSIPWPQVTSSTSNLYTLAVQKDGTYKVYVNAQLHLTGDIYRDHHPVPTHINDTTATRPETWVSESRVRDPNSVKPDDWDDQEWVIHEKDLVPPADWDEEEDGEWRPPVSPNPRFQGRWKPKMIPNPAYRGPWRPPIIPNPDFVRDPLMGKYEDIGTVGLDLWQVNAGSIFDNILIADSFKDAEGMGKLWKKQLAAEHSVLDGGREQVEAAKLKMRKARALARSVEEDDEEDEDDLPGSTRHL